MPPLNLLRIVRIARIVGHLLAGLAFIGALVVALFSILLLVHGEAFAAEQPAPGMTCTYTQQSRDARTYAVQVVVPLRDAVDKDGRPWLWVKRVGEPRYMSFLAVAADLSECTR